MSKTSNFERGMGQDNQGISLHVIVEIKPIEHFWNEWRKIFAKVTAESVQESRYSVSGLFADRLN